MSETGRCSEEDLEEKEERLLCGRVAEGRRWSLFGTNWGPGGGGAGDAATRGVAKLLFMREKRDVTSAYEDWSFSSSSENGLNDVKLVTSSPTLVLLRDLPGATLGALCTGE